MVNLRAAEANVFSQSGEDGAVRAIFEVMGTDSRHAVEFGAGNGVYLSNTRSLILQGWSACLIESDPVKAKNARLAYATHAYPNVQIHNVHILPGNIEELLKDVPDRDLMSIDLDSNDYYVRAAIERVRPRVLLMEYNASFPPPIRRVVKYHPANYWDGSDYFGASLQSLVELNKQKGYELIHCTHLGINAIFVEEGQAGLFGPRPQICCVVLRPALLRSWRWSRAGRQWASDARWAAAGHTCRRANREGMGRATMRTRNDLHLR
jgi:hypothetical protein